MTRAERSIQLQGRIFVTGSIEVVTGLHIGGSRTAQAIGGVQNSVVRDPVTRRPYIPGSSLKGKLRSLLEKHYSKSQQWLQHGVRIHVCYRFDDKGNRVPDEEAYSKCEVCPIFGTPAQFGVMPTRLTVRDVPLDEESAQRLAGTRSENGPCSPRGDMPPSLVLMSVAVWAFSSTLSGETNSCTSIPI